MAVTIRNFVETPPGMWRYRIPEIIGPTAWVRDFFAYNDLEEEVVRRYKAAHLAAPSNLRQLIVEQLCEQLPDNWCGGGSRFGNFIRDAIHEFARVFQGTATLVDWFVSSGRQRVPIEEAEARAERCVSCVFNQQPQGCTTCNIKALNEKVNEIVGGTVTRFDTMLQACAVCGCQLRAKIHLPMDVLQRHLTDQQKAQFPPAHNGFKGCWLRTEPITSPSHA